MSDNYKDFPTQYVGARSKPLRGGLTSTWSGILGGGETHIVFSSILMVLQRWLPHPTTP